MNYLDKINYYKQRSFGERISVAADFMKQNWKVIYKYLFISTIPFILIISYFFLQYLDLVTLYTADPLGFIHSDSFVELIIGTSLFGIFYALMMIFMSGYLGSALVSYEKNELNRYTEWHELSQRTFSYTGKTFLIYFLLGILFTIASTAIGMLVSMMSFLFVGGLGVALLIFFLFVALLAILPPLSLAIYPAYFEGAKTWASIGKGFSLGFKNWGTTSGMLFIIGCATFIVQFILGIPTQVLTFFPDNSFWLRYLFAMISVAGSVVAFPFSIIFMAFQYFSIREKEDGVSLQNKVDEFDNL